MFHFVLAEKLGMTVKEMLNRMTSKEYTEWLAFYKIRQVEENLAMNNAKHGKR